MPPPDDTQTHNTPLPPSVEKAYYRKCISLKRRLTEVEKANEVLKLRRTRLDRGVLKMRLERAFLLDEIRRRTEEGDGSEGSEGNDAGEEVREPERVVRDRRRRVAAPVGSTGGAGAGMVSGGLGGAALAPTPTPQALTYAPGAAGTPGTAANDAPSAAREPETPYPPAFGREIMTPQQQQQQPAQQALQPTPSAAPYPTPAAPIPASPYGGVGQVNGDRGEVVVASRAPAATAGEAVVGAGEGANGERRTGSSGDVGMGGVEPGAAAGQIGEGVGGHS